MKNKKIKESFQGESLEDMSFVDLFVEKILAEIKNVIRFKINLDEDGEYKNSCRRPNESRVSNVDNKMREILTELLVVEQDQINLKYNFPFFLTGNKQVEKDKFRSSLILYYTALYFDNLSLLKKLFQRYMIDLSKPSHLPLCVLDKEFSECFREKDYLKFISERKEIMVTFYSSLRECSADEKKKYYEMFARIMCNRSFLPEKIRGIFTKDRMDIYGEETYLNATLEQYQEIMTIKLVSRKAIGVAKYIINNTDDVICYGHNTELMFQLFTAEELLEHKIPYSSGSLFEEANMHQIDLKRVKTIYFMNPQIEEYNYYLYPNIMKLFDDCTLASFTPLLAYDLVFDEDAKDYLKGKLTPEKEKIIRKKVDSVLSKKRENQGKNLLKTIFNRIGTNN